jgi:hypothetical protein
MTSTSHLVRNFSRVAVARGLTCPACGQPFTPHSVLLDDAITLRCDGCQLDAFRCEPETEPGSEEDV